MEIELSIKRSFQGDKRAFSISKIHASPEASLQAILANRVSPYICNNHFLAWIIVLDTFVPPINNSNLLQTQSRSQQIPKPWYPSLYLGFQIIQQVTNTTVSYIFLFFFKLPPFIEIFLRHLLLCRITQIFIFFICVSLISARGIVDICIVLICALLQIDEFHSYATKHHLLHHLYGP